MKNFTFLCITAFFFFLSSPTEAQKTKANNKFERCGTMKNLDFWLASNPGAVETRQKEMERLLKNPQAGGKGNRLQAIVTIPVVFHVVLPNPFFVTDADLQAQVDRLNLDYSGLNPDSTNVPAAFQAVRGHSQIRFVLAKRNPAGQLTNGIERRSSALTYDNSTGNDPIKSAASGGLDAWDANQYLNIWIGIGDGTILGYATFPGVSAANQQGLVIDIVGTGTNPCYIDPDYNLGRTMVHETGHYFGLYHIWGDETGCTTSDFRNLPGTCLITDATLAGANGDQSIGDTPNQGDENYGCLSGTVANSCGSAAGDMYQNFMDYTNDACMTMFTAKQVARMEWVIANCRSGYLTTLGGTAPTGATTLDALPAASVNPGGFEVNGCSGVAYTDAFSCPGNITPKFRVTNNGLNTITGLVVGYRLNNGTAVTQNVAVNIPTGGFYIASFPTIPIGVGNHSFKFFTAQPNGGADQVPANDTLIQAFRVMAPTTVPVVEGFETAPPFANFTIDNPNADVTWVRTTPGRAGSAGKITIDNYNFDNTNTIDQIRSSAITVNPAGGYSLNFDLAHKNYPQADSYDTLSVLVSSNCGQTFTTVYKKWGPTLATAGSSSDPYTTPAANEWRTESIDLTGAILSSGQLVIVIRNTGRYGNYIHLDNINLTALGARDVRLVSINSPAPTLCAPNFTPSVTIGNSGTEDVTSFKVGYRIDNGVNTIATFVQTIPVGGTVTVNLAGATASSGTHTITAFTADPVSITGTGDSRRTNDTTSKSFTVASLINLPIVEGFETSFPPAGWSIVNPNNNNTWIRTTPGRNSNFSAFIDNYSIPALDGQTDDLRLPLMNVAGADSVIVRFDVAHRNFPDSSDILTVLATNDCANTLTTIYQKSGTTLATATASNAPFLNPTANQWRAERLSLGGSILSTGTLGIYFRNTSDYGNNIFIDNVNITALFKRDLQMVSVNSLPNLICATSVTPNVTVRNIGSETVTAFKVSYTVNGGGLQTQNVTGVSLARDAQMNVTLPVITTGTAGTYNLRIFSFEPITASGTGDMNTRNDTLQYAFAVPGTTTAPLTENFVNATFPPASWSVSNPDASIGWVRNSVGNGNVGSAFVNTYNYAEVGQRDILASPIISFGAVDSVRLKFDVAAATYSYPGSTNIPLDTLEVLVTRDCGNTFTSVYKKWGIDLQTVNDPNSPQDIEFVPSGPSQWRTDSVNISQFAGQSPLMFMFRVTNNFENNIYIDNINFSTQILPPQLKQQGYIIYPTAFQNRFTLWHYLTPTTLKYINVMNAAGQLVYTRQFSGNANRQMQVDLTGKAAGVYIVEVGYTDASKKVVQRVVKY